MNKRRAPRIKKRLTCTLHYQGKRHSGLVLDVSANGLFVQTSAAPDPGDLLRIELSLPGRSELLQLEGKAARRRVVPVRLRAVAQGGIGVALVNAPEPFFEFVAEAMREQVKPPEKSPPKKRKASSLERQARKLALRRALGPRAVPEREPAEQAPEAKPETPSAKRSRKFRVRVKLGLRKQTLELEASSEEEARLRALAQAGKGWRVLRCEPA